MHSHYTRPAGRRQTTYAVGVPSEREYEAVGIYDPASSAAADRLALLEWLSHRGFSLEELVDATKSCHLPALAGDYHLLRGSRLTRKEAIERSGLSREELDRLSLAAGFSVPDDDTPAYTDGDLSSFRTFAEGATMFSEAEALHFVRVLGSSLARIAEAAVALFLNDIERPHVEAGGGEFALAQKNIEAVEMLDGVIEMLDPLLRRHMNEAITRARTAWSGNDDPDLSSYAVGFVDLVGFTPLTQELSARDLGIFVREFEDRAHDLVGAAGARVVKLIGDEVMFVALEPNQACAAARSLMFGFDDIGADITPRGALTYGDVVARGGDYYGPVVNLASRMADLAVPMELLVSPTVAARAVDHEFEPAGRRMLKGFDGAVQVCAMVLTRP